MEINSLHILLAFIIGLFWGGIWLGLACRHELQQWRKYAAECENEIAYLERQLDVEQRIYARLETQLAAKFSRAETFRQPENNDDENTSAETVITQDQANPARYIFTTQD
ncbi:hypothetical protein [Alysiella filiformis]|uniref:Uncharacterized protein n=1 Tax=Alysiella filiformis DSM 16848 TaxID=1120981 RepID=A0A286E6U4_9NEIS|nr:hypothetical protein [Alysiella filiformis]QMT31528.1 hypothetical protein H3L97_01045 [Alysiella filiformis]UBQ55459.1 hypothetical protein JF568_07630 [Alysiella filiformis DSM 16848]SOD66609.1 hypothetical protein SAMN02746062_00666 [Alysiella filiformis DSM 16848]